MRGDIVCHRLMHPFAGQRAIGMAGAPAIQEQPLHTAICHVRDWNYALREAAGQLEILALQEEGLLPPNSHARLDGSKLVVSVPADWPTSSHDAHAPQPHDTEDPAAATWDLQQDPSDSSDSELRSHAARRLESSSKSSAKSYVSHVSPMHQLYIHVGLSTAIIACLTLQLSQCCCTDVTYSIKLYLTD